MMVGRWVSLWDCLFLGAMLNFRGVAMENGPFVDVFPIEYGDIPASYVSLPVGKYVIHSYEGNSRNLHHPLVQCEMAYLFFFRDRKHARFTPNSWGNLLFEGNLGWWNIINWPDLSTVSFLKSTIYVKIQVPLIRDGRQPTWETRTFSIFMLPSIVFYVAKRISRGWCIVPRLKPT